MSINISQPNQSVRQRLFYIKWGTAPLSKKANVNKKNFVWKRPTWNLKTTEL